MFAIGQRWSSDTESDLGLGIVRALHHRQVDIYFPAVDDTRCYAMDNAPLSRVRFQVGDRIELEDGPLLVREIQERDGLLFYGDGKNWQPEARLSASIRLNKAIDRLLAGRPDSNKAYVLRLQALQKQAQLKRGIHQGLLGARISLLPHQLYIAREVSDRELPRVLLADEVGLGKTIEAGLIIHRLLRNERVRRVLILTPENLLHQWLVEMLRRFNLSFALLDEERCLGLEEQENGDNPFLHQQLVLSPLADMARRPRRCAQLVAADWDLVVVDEAHHLQWRQPSTGVSEPVDAGYDLVQKLAAASPALLLLTATPEQLGVEGHFARLRLLDPQRFHDLPAFLGEEKNYQPVATAARALLTDAPLSTEQIGLLQPWLEESIVATPDARQRRKWLLQLVDRHGTGRVLFRNTRASVQGFPQRRLYQYELPLPDAYLALYAKPGAADRDGDLRPLLYPERLVPNWTALDPRIEWLKRLLTDHPGEKMLLICHEASTALELHTALRVRFGRHCSLFHQGMTIIERDRAAAYFADPEEGSQLLIGSEIGSEGRNFQFAHHLLLFDLPLNCDLLEQRIGRLDRIGQQQDIRIHVPCFKNHPSQALLRIYHQGLGLFANPSPAAQTLLNEYETRIRAVLTAPADRRESMLDELIDTLIPARNKLQEVLEQGRDLLLEWHSCDQQAATGLIAQLEEEERLAESELQPFVDQVCDLYGIEQEEDNLECHILRPGDHLRLASFPHLPEDGLRYTTLRRVAVSRDDVAFFTWEHPLVASAIDLIIGAELGNCCVAYLPRHEHKPGDFYLQIQFLLSCQAPGHLQLQRYLPEASLYVTRLPTGKLRKGQVDFPVPVEELEKTAAALLLRNLRKPLQAAVQQVEAATGQLVPQQVEQAMADMRLELDAEVERLQSIRRYNPLVREDEIKALLDKKSALTHHLQQAQLRIDSIRVIFCA